MSGFHLAQVNIGRLRAPIEDPIMEGFRSQLDVINAERLSLAARAQNADAARALTAAQANVFRALGGGWKAPESRGE